MISDQDIIEWISELGMKIEKVSGNNFFQINVTPPIGGPSVTIIRPKSNDKYYIFTIIINLDKEPNRNIIRSIAMDLMRMNVEFFFTPEDKPINLHIAKLLFGEGLNRNDLLNTLTLVKNAAYLSITWLKES